MRTLLALVLLAAPAFGAEDSTRCMNAYKHWNTVSRLDPKSAEYAKGLEIVHADLKKGQCRLMTAGVKKQCKELDDLFNQNRERNQNYVWREESKLGCQYSTLSPALPSNDAPVKPHPPLADPFGRPAGTTTAPPTPTGETAAAKKCRELKEAVGVASGPFGNPTAKSKAEADLAAAKCP